MLSTTAPDDSCETITTNDETRALLSKPNEGTAALTENTLPLPEWLTALVCILLGGIVVFAPHLVIAAMSDAQKLLEHTLPDLGWALFLHLTFLLSMISEERQAADVLVYGLYTGIYSIAYACIGIPMHHLESLSVAPWPYP